MEFSLAYYTIGLVCGIITVIGTVWGLRGWFSKQFSDMQEFVTAKLDRLNSDFTDKLEYHERHDDQRFSSLTNDLWTMRLDLAKDGLSREAIKNI